MRYLKFTYVDVVTENPLWKEYARTGIMLPEGVVHKFTIEGSQSSGKPTLYGISEDAYNPPPWMVEVPEEAFFSTLNQELKERVNSKRRQGFQQSVVYNETLLTPNREFREGVRNLYQDFSFLPSTQVIDFEYSPTCWMSLTKNDVEEILRILASRDQVGFSWCRMMHEKINTLPLSLETMDCVLPILEEINSFNVPRYGEQDELAG